MKAKQMAPTLMFFMCFALFFTGCGTLFWSKADSVEINAPRPDRTPAPTHPDTIHIEPIKVEIINLPSTDTTPASPHAGTTNNGPIHTTETTQITVSVDPRSTPLTWDLVRNIRNAGLNLRDLDYSLSKSFAMTIVERKDTPQKLEISEGVLTRPQEQSITTDRIEFTPDLKGTMSKEREESSETFVIIFNDGKNDIPLTFKRNSQGRYALDSAMINADQRTVFSIEDDPPQLCILSELNEHLEMLAILNAKQAVSRSWQSYEKPAYQKIPAGGSSRQFSPSRRIDDTQNSVTKTGIIKYVKNQNSGVNSATLSKLIDTYISEAEIEGINLDIAIAQMLHATNYLRNRMTTHNYAGLSTNGVRWDGKFPQHLSDGMTEGVRAHIQHLKGYVSAQRPVPCVDPRYDLLAEKGFWGQVKTFDELFKAWSQNPAYGNEINRILKGLRSSGN
jgi:hypothetical protein